MTISAEKIDLVMSLFRGREDIYAINRKQGYVPAYDVDWDAFHQQQSRGGTFADFPGKTPLPLTRGVIARHLSGQIAIGIYPLLRNNHSCFIAVDFDKHTWLEECRSLLATCAEYEIPASLERSKSGEGGHVWIFCTEPYPARKSRRVLLHLLRIAGIVSSLEKESSFDRLFPNQDRLTGKGFGNLIARKRQPALILVHQRALADQWMESIQSFLHIPKQEIGEYSGNKKTRGEQITVGMMQNLHRNPIPDDFAHAFGTIIVDECHHIPAKTFRKTITAFNPKYLYGFTATPMRKHND